MTARTSGAPLRLIDAGVVSPAHAQALYHGLAYARTDATPDTVVLCTPSGPHVCIGFHQDAARELDLAFCRARGLAVLRRETGGGAVYLDQDQLFVQWVMSPDRLPLRVDARFARFAAPLVQAYRALGVEAELRPPNDIHVRDRKVTGTAAARIAEAEVVVGNFLLDFDTEAMARIVRAPSDAFRAQVARSLARYMTSLRRELGRKPAYEEVAARYVRACAAAFGAELRPSAPTAEESAAVERAVRRLDAEPFAPAGGGLRRPGLKVHAGVWVVETELRTAAGELRVTARVHDARIEEISLTGAPDLGDAARESLARALTGVELQPEALHRALRGSAADDSAACVQALLALDPRRAGERGTENGTGGAGVEGDGPPRSDSARDDGGSLRIGHAGPQRE